MRNKGNTITYLRLPPRTTIDQALNIADIALPYAVALRGRLLQTGVTSLSQPGLALGDAYTVVLLIAASDVTLLRVEVPPLPAHRLHLVLPALVEDRLIGDAADCVMAAGKDRAGKRAVAVVQRDWLLAWTRRLRDAGVRRIRALPVQLCLPLQADHIAAALMVNGDASELVIRYGADEGIGLPLTDADDVTLPDHVLQLLSTMAGEQVVDLFLPPDFVGEYQSALTSGRHAVKLGAMHELTWASLIDAASDAEPDLMSGVSEPESTGIEWQRWRWPLRLALLLIVVNIAALQIDSWRLQNEATDLKGAMTEIYQRSFPNETPVLDPLAQMQRKIAASRQRAGETSPSDFLALAAAFGDAWTSLQTQTGAGAQAIAAIVYRDQMLEIRFKPAVKLSIEAAQAVLATHALQARVMNVEGEAGVWQVRSVQ
jgi:general secretion pathway protein L